MEENKFTEYERNLIVSCKCILDSINAKDIKIYSTKSISPFYDYQIIGTVSSNRQLNAACHHAEEEAYKNGYKIRGVEGRNGGAWVLIDMYSAVINVFTEEEREKYDLDKLWRDLPQVKFKK